VAVELPVLIQRVLLNVNDLTRSQARASGSLDKLEGDLASVGRASDDTSQKLTQTGRSVDQLGPKMGKLRGEADRTARSTSALSLATRDAAERADDASRRFGSAADGINIYGEATRDATARTLEIDRVMKQTGLSADEATKAYGRMTKAQRDTEASSIAVEKAESRLADARTRLAGLDTSSTERDRAKAMLDVRDAELRVVDAHDRRTTSELNLSRQTREMASAEEDYARRRRSSISDTDRQTDSTNILSRAVGNLGNSGRSGGGGMAVLGKAVNLLKWPAIIAGVNLAVEGIVALGAAAFSVISALGPLVGLLGAIPGAALGIAAVMGTIKSAMSGVTDAVKQHGTEQDKTGATARRNADQMQSATRRVEDSQRSLTRATEDAARSVEDANERVTDAIERAAEVAESASEAREDANERVSDAEEAYAETVEDVAERITDADERIADSRERLAEVVENVAERNADADRRVADARERAAEVAEDVGERIEDADERVGDARQRLSDVYERTEDAMESANDRVADAEEALADAQDSARRAQEQLIQARADAAEQLEDLAFAAEGASISEERAQLRLIDAQAEYARVMGGRRSTDRERQEAALDLRDAELALAQAQDRRTDTSEELADATEKGIEGSDLVQGAIDGVKDANEAVADSEESLADAREARERTQRDNLREIAEANKAVRDAVEDRVEAERDGADQIADANEAVDEAVKDRIKTERDGAKQIANAIDSVSDAERDRVRVVEDGAEAIVNAQERIDEAVEDVARVYRDTARDIAASQEAIVDAQEDAALAQRDAVQSVEDATRNLAEAMEDLREVQRETSGATSKFAEAMKELSPEGRALVNQLIAIKEEFKGVQAAAQRGMFPGLTAGLAGVRTLMPELKTIFFDTGQALGGIAAEAGKLISSPAFGRDLVTIAGNNATALRTLGGEAVGPNGVATGLQGLVVGFMNVAKAAAPLVQWLAELGNRFGEWTAKVTSGEGAQARMEAFFYRTREVMTTVGHILRDLGVGLFNMGKAGSNASDVLLGKLENVSARFREWTGSMEGQNKLKTYFDGAIPTIEALGRLIGDLSRGLGAMAQPGALAPLIDQIRLELLPNILAIMNNFKGAFGPGLITALSQVTEIIAKMTAQGGPLQAFLQTLILFLDAINWGIDNIPGFKELFFVLATGLGTLSAVKFIASPFTKFAAGLSEASGLVGGFANAVRGLPGEVDAAAGPITKAGQWLGTQFQDKILDGSRDVGKRLIDGLKIGMSGAEGETIGAAQKIGKGIGTALKGAGSGISSVFRTIGTTLMAALAPAMSAVTAGATAMWTALTAPISLVIIAIAAVVAAIVAAYFHIKPFRDFIDSMWQAIQQGWDKYVMPVLRLLGGFFVDVFRDGMGAASNLVGQAMGVIRSVVEAAFGAVKTLWETVLQPAFEAIGWFIDTILTPIFKVGFMIITAVVKDAFELIVGIFRLQWNIISGVVELAFEVIKGLWNNVLWPVFTSIDNVLRWLYEQVFLRIFNLIRGVVETVFTGIGWVWENILHPVFTKIAEVVGWIYENVIVRYFNLWRTIIEGAFNAIKAVWDNVLHPVFTTIARVVGDLWNRSAGPAFNGIQVAVDTAFKGIKTVWDTVLHPIFKTMIGIFEWVRDKAGDIWRGLGSAIGGAFSGITTALRNAVGPVARFLATISDAIGGILNAVGLNNVGNLLKTAATNLRSFAEGREAGGTVPARRAGGRSVSGGGARRGPYDNAPMVEVGPGFVTAGVRAIVGEGNPAYPEYVVPTDPRYRRRAEGLYEELGRELRVRKLAEGGLPSTSVPTLGVGWDTLGDVVGGIGGGIKGLVGGVINIGGMALSELGGLAAGAWRTGTGLIRKGAANALGAVWPLFNDNPVPLVSFIPRTMNTAREHTLSWIRGREERVPSKAAGGKLGGRGRGSVPAHRSGGRMGRAGGGRAGSAPRLAAGGMVRSYQTGGTLDSAALRGAMLDMRATIREGFDAFASVVDTALLAVEIGLTQVRIILGQIGQALVEMHVDLVGKLGVDFDLLRTHLTTTTGQVNAKLTDFQLDLLAKVGALQTGLSGDLGGVRDSLNTTLGNVHSAVGQVSADVGSMHTAIDTALGGIGGQLTTIDTNLTSGLNTISSGVNTTTAALSPLPSIATDTATLPEDTAGWMDPSFVGVGAVVAGAVGEVAPAITPALATIDTGIGEVAPAIVPALPTADAIGGSTGHYINPTINAQPDPPSAGAIGGSITPTIAALPPQIGTEVAAKQKTGTAKEAMEAAQAQFAAGMREKAILDEAAFQRVFSQEMSRLIAMSHGRASGAFVTNKATMMVGEGSRTHPEYVIPTDPKYAQRSRALFTGLAGDLGVSLMAAGGTVGGTAGVGGAQAGAINLRMALASVERMVAAVDDGRATTAAELHRQTELLRRLIVIEEQQLAATRAGGGGPAVVFEDGAIRAADTQEAAVSLTRKMQLLAEVGAFGGRRR
jgi:phage-related protein/methyl-accepting chemotaxis protein